MLYVAEQSILMKQPATVGLEDMFLDATTLFVSLALWFSLAPAPTSAWLKLVLLVYKHFILSCSHCNLWFNALYWIIESGCLLADTFLQWPKICCQGNMVLSLAQ